MSGSGRDAPRSRRGSDTIRVTVTSETGSREFAVTPECTVRQLKRSLCERMEASTEQLLLIHSGRVLAESQLISHLKGQDSSVCLCMTQRLQRSPSPPGIDTVPEIMRSELPAVLQPDLGSSTPSPTSPFCLVEGLNSLGLENSEQGFFPALQQQMERQLLTDPEMLRRVLSSPLVQETLSSSYPQLTRQLILSNPQFQQFMQTNPEVEEMLNNTDVIAQVFELIRNPDMIDDVIPNEDRVLNNLPQEEENQEAIIGDLRNLQMLETKIEEYCVRLAQIHTGEPPRATAPSGSQKTPEGETDPTPAFSSHSEDPLRGFSASPRTHSNSPSINTAGLQSLLEEITASPGLIESLLSGPYVSSLLNCLSQNPDLAAQMLLSHPLFSGNPQLQQQMRQQIPLFLQQMQSPELLAAMLNPKALEALLQIQQGLQTLAAEAPALIPAAGLGHTGTGVNINVPQSASEPVLTSQSESGPQVTTATEQQQQFVQQMLQTLANANSGVHHEESDLHEDL
ncbi:unnamed protein product [Ophioblennius macclurei]